MQVEIKKLFLPSTLFLAGSIILRMQVIRCKNASEIIKMTYLAGWNQKWFLPSSSYTFVWGGGRRLFPSHSEGARASRGQAALILCEAPVPILFYIFFSSDLSSVNMSDCDFSWLMPTVSLTAVFFPSPGFLSWILPLPLAQYSWLMHTFSCWQSFLLFQGFSWIFISIGLFRVISL